MGQEVPPERDQPHEVPVREVEHDEPVDPDEWPWEAGRYPVGSMTKTEWFEPDEETEDAWRDDLHRRETARKALGGFGFCVERTRPTE